ncbi:unnamed protein product [Caenorhabditis bovis]|uniref:Uncharacterized protein n=1 Tax=Caenorhabditis bovis TaxID=2654633 RepID=A0A8S1EFP9_9PELO|nr:unnamed protein product [Caenorhabditis bovis]
MMSAALRSNTSGSTQNGTIQFEEIDETKRWFSRRFFCLFVIGILLVLATMAIIIVIIVLILQLKDAGTQAQVRIDESKQQFAKFAESIRTPLEKIGPTLEKLGLQLPNLPKSPTGLPPIQPSVFGPTTPDPPRMSPTARYEWKGCENHGKCKKTDYSKAPLVILSLDGFAREYFDRNIVQTLNHIADCGVKAEKVYPSYPSKTFPNHYSIVTGLYPESHGITDNSVYDPSLSPILESMKATKYDNFFKGEPIWSVFKRVAGGRAHCLFWVGCAYNATGYAPDIAPSYNQELPLRNRVDQIIDWLLLPESERPGLITAYLHEPDNAGHYQIDDEDVDRELAEIDNDLDYMMSRLNQENLLECINLVILSDHGMQKLHKTYFFEDYINMHGLIGAKGVVGRLYIQDQNVTTNDLVDHLRCKIDDVKVYTRDDIPVRKHYSKDARVGDIIMEGPPGTSFFPNKSYYQINGDHGYDYLNEKMHTIFFARGPSFKQNVETPAFQNVEYMNLWMHLLGIDNAIPTNGTNGFFDDILTNPPIKAVIPPQIGECTIIGLPSAKLCSGKGDLASLNSRLGTCSFSPRILPIVSENHCFQNYCIKSLIIPRNTEDKSIGISELVSVENTASNVDKDVFTFVNSKYQSSCLISITNNMTSIAVGRDMQNIDSSFVKFPDNFVNRKFEPLRSKTLNYIKQYGKVYVISGTANDVDHNGVVDGKGSSPTHFYRILITCTGGWISEDPPKCTKFEEMKTLSFIMPINEQSFTDCMNDTAILLEYSATIWDVERIAGFELNFPDLSRSQNAILRRFINAELW